MHLHNVIQENLLLFSLRRYFILCTLAYSSIVQSIVSALLPTSSSCEMLHAYMSCCWISLPRWIIWEFARHVFRERKILGNNGFWSHFWHFWMLFQAVYGFLAAWHGLWTVWIISSDIFRTLIFFQTHDLIGGKSIDYLWDFSKCPLSKQRHFLTQHSLWSLMSNWKVASEKVLGLMHSIHAKFFRECSNTFLTL